MGLSIAISGVIILTTLVLLFMSMIGILDSFFSIEKTSTAVSELEESISNTKISLNSLEVLSGVSSVNFTLNNDGSEKLWNFEKFNLFISYETGSSKLTEELSYNGDCLSTIPNPGDWCIETITIDSLDPGLLNSGESAEIWTNASSNLGTGAVAVIISTHNGVVNTIGGTT